jgi:DNA-binding NarL/FixJ family response regulator
MSAVRVLLADDHVPFRKAVADLLAAEHDFQLVGEAGDGAEALEMARELLPDVILMDLSMPRLDGLEATRRIKAELPYVRIVILTARDDERVVFDAVRGGAHAYVLKSSEPSAMLRTLRQVARGEAPISPTMAARLLQGLAGIPWPTASPSMPASGLTPREHEALRLITRGKHTGTIAATLGVAEGTLGNIVQNILEKLYLEERVRSAMWALRQEVGPAPDRDARASSRRRRRSPPLS